LILYALIFVLAFCSIVYELLLGQTLSAFFGNTVLRYSVTIGLYMASMGLGALYLQWRRARSSVLRLQVVEILLTVCGGGSVVGIFLLDGAGLPTLPLSIWAHFLIIVIGVLTGMEIPLLIEIRNRDRRSSETSVLGVDYIGAFAGTLVFAFYFYPTFGLVPSAFLVSLLNAVVGMLLLTQRGKLGSGERGRFHTLLAGQALLLAVLALLLWRADAISEMCLSLYLGSS
jgi:spermidine synthase